MKAHYTIILVALVPICFVCDLLFGNVQIPFYAFIQEIFGETNNPLWHTIIFNLRLPRAVCAVLAGIALPISGLLMQTLFRNPLADPYILGVSTGASLGVAICTLAGGISLGMIGSIVSNLCVAISALAGSLAVTLIIVLVAPKIQNTATLLIVGIMIGSVLSAVVSVLQYFANPNELHAFVMWTMGSFSGVNKTELVIMACCIIPMAIVAFLCHKPLDALLLGDNYARSLGVNTRTIRVVIIVISAIFASIITAFAGPIAFVGMTIPHVARFLLRTSNHRSLIITSALIGVNTLLVCDLISQLPWSSAILPINTVTALFGAPIVIWIIYHNPQRNR